MGITQFQTKICVSQEVFAQYDNIFKQAFSEILTKMEEFFPEDFSQDIMKNKFGNKVRVGLWL